MSDIPEDVVKAAREVAWEIDATDDPRVVDPIARAIHAAVEAEREDISKRVWDRRDFDGSTGDEYDNGYTSALNDALAAIRTPSVPVKETIA